MAKMKKTSRKCPKCGMELGQKNLCPVCLKAKKTPEKAEKAAEADSGNPSGDNGSYSSELAGLLEPFVKENMDKWNNKFDDFYDSLQEKAKKNVDYKAAVAQCKRWSCIFNEIQKMLGDKQEISADLMIEIMEKIPQKFSEITDMKARSLAREFCQKNAGVNRKKRRKVLAVAKKAAAPARKVASAYWFK